MAGAPVQQADGVVTGSGTVLATGTGGTNFGANLTAGNLKLFVIFYTAASAKTFTISDANNNNAAHIQVGNFYNATDSQGAVWGYVKNQAAGVGTTTATANAAVTFFCLYCEEWSGLDTVNPYQTSASNRQPAPGTGADVVTSGLMTPTAQPAIVFGLCNDFTTAANVPNAGTGFTGRTKVWLIGALSTRPEDKRITSTAAVAATYTAVNGTDLEYTIGMIFSEAGATSGDVPAPLMPKGLWGIGRMSRRLGLSPAAPLNNYVLPADTGVFTYAGSAASMLATRLLAAVTGVYALTGIAALLAFGHKLLANTGVYTLTGSAASMLATRLLAATKGTFLLTGSAAATLYKRILIAGTGVFTLTGGAVNIARTYVLGAATGVYSLIGRAADVVYSAGVVTAISEWVRRRRGRN